VRADLNSFLAASMHSFPLAGLLMIASCNYGDIIHEFIAKWNNMASADFSLRICLRRPFRHKARSPQVRAALLHRTTAAFTPPRLGHESFAVSCPLALLGNAFYAVLVYRLAIYAPRFLPTLGRPRAVALRFIRCDQLMAGLAPAGVRPCWAHKTQRPRIRSVGAFLREAVALNRQAAGAGSSCALFASRKAAAQHRSGCRRSCADRS